MDNTPASPSPTPSIARDVVTPVTAILFIVSTVTGVMLLLHWKGAWVHASHEWLSLVFSAIAIWHLVRNWRTFTRYFKSSPALSAAVIALAVSLVFTYMTARDAGGGGPRKVFMTLSRATVTQVAPAFGLTPDAALARLKQAGYSGSAEESLNAIGQRANKRGADVIMLLSGNMPH